MNVNRLLIKEKKRKSISNFIIMHIKYKCKFKRVSSEIGNVGGVIQ